MADELFENESETQMSREQAAARLREIADQLSRHNEVRVTAEGGLPVTVKVPDQVTVEVEVESGDESEIEITISW